MRGRLFHDKHSAQMSQPIDPRRRSSVAALRLTHPQTVLAFTNRISSVVSRGKVLTPQQTQKYRSATLCDFDRLSVPNIRPGTRVEQHETSDLMMFVRDAKVQRALSPQCSTSQHRRMPSPEMLGRVSITTQDVFMQPMTGKELCELRREKERILRCGSAGPQPSAVAMPQEKERRLDPSRLSTALRRAVYGQSLDRVIERNEERQNTAMSDSQFDGGNGNDPFDDTVHVTVGDGGESSFSPIATKRNKNNNLFLMGAQEYLAGREQGEEAQTIDLSSSVRPPSSGGSNGASTTFGTFSATQDLATYFTNLADPLFRKSLTSITQQAYHLVRKLFQEMDEKHEGVVDLAKALHFHQKYPKRLTRDILDNLKVELDGRVYLDELLRVHFPSVPHESIEQLMELYEPKVQSLEMVKPETLKKMEALYAHIVDTYRHATFASWLASRREAASGEAPAAQPGTGEESSPRPHALGIGLLSPVGQPLSHDASGKPSPRTMDDTASMNTGRRSPSTATVAGDEAAYTHRSRASSITRSEAGTLAPSTARRHSARGPGGHRGSIDSSNVSAQAQNQSTTPTAPMNALQLLLHLQNTTTAFSAKDLSQLFRLKHLTLRPSFPLILSRGVRRAAAMAHSSRSGGSVFGRQAAMANSASMNCVVEPSTGVLIPLPLLQGPVTPVGEASAPYLTHCVVRQSDFVLLFMDYFVMKQEDGYVEPYDPGLKAYLDKIHWEKMFPHTGPVRDYFAPLPQS